MDLRHRPRGGNVFHRDRRGRINLARAVAGLAQFIGQGQRETAGVCGRDQFGRIGASSLDVAAGGVKGHLLCSTRSADGAFATPSRPQPKDRGLPGVWFHCASRLDPQL